jgi:hypothetical protein
MTVMGELEQGLRLMKEIDHEEGRRAGELAKLGIGEASAMTDWPINKRDALTEGVYILIKVLHCDFILPNIKNCLLEVF